MKTDRATIKCEGGRHQALVIALIGRYFNGANVTPTIGLWKGQREDSLSIELLDTPDALAAPSVNSFEDAALLLADDIRRECNQEAVFVLHDTINLRILSS